MREVEADHKDVPYHTNVRWLDQFWKSCSASLGVPSRNSYRFRNVRKTNTFPEICDVQQSTDLAFVVDDMDHLNKLNHEMIDLQST